MKPVFQCGICASAFIENGKLKQHIEANHEGTKHYPCNFLANYVNIDVITMPTGEKPMHNFVKRNVKCSPMHIAAERSNLKLCEHIMDRIVDNNQKDYVISLGG